MKKMDQTKRKAARQWLRQLVFAALFGILATNGFASGPYDIGQTVVFISDHYPTNDFHTWKNWITEDWPEVDYIIHPLTLDQFIAEIKRIGQVKPIQRLYFFGHMNSNNVFLTKELPYFNTKTVRQLRQKHPLLPKYFTSNAVDMNLLF
jgi:hypothetical protein